LLTPLRWQNGVSAVVALMGSSCSKEQAEWIRQKVIEDGTVWVMTDGDDAGRRCAGSIFVQVGPERLVRYVKLAEGEQPTDWTPEDIFGSFNSMNEESGTSEETVVAEPENSGNDESSDPAAAE
jgi:DNA primase